MARVHRIEEWCDNHADRESVPGTTRRVDLGRGPYELELCETCWEEIPAGKLDKLIAEWGRQVDGKAGTEKQRVKCPFCTAPPLHSARNWQRHLDSKHPDQTADLLRVIAGPSRPGTQVPEPEPEGPTCPECGKGFATAKGMGAHRWRTHGVPGSSSSATVRRSVGGD